MKGKGGLVRENKAISSQHLSASHNRKRVPCYIFVCQHQTKQYFHVSEANRQIVDFQLFKAFKSYLLNVLEVAFSERDDCNGVGGDL